MTLPDLYLDEDTQSDALIAALRSRGINLLTTSEAGMTKRTGEDQLRGQFESRKRAATSALRPRSAGFQTCCVADFQIGSPWK